MKYPYCSGAQLAILRCSHTEECIERRGCPKLKGSEGIPSQKMPNLRASEKPSPAISEESAMNNSEGSR